MMYYLNVDLLVLITMLFAIWLYVLITVTLL